MRPGQCVASGRASNPGTAFAYAAGAAGPRRSNGRRQIHPHLAEATELLIADQQHKSSKNIPACSPNYKDVC